MVTMTLTTVTEVVLERAVLAFYSTYPLLPLPRPSPQGGQPSANPQTALSEMQLPDRRTDPLYIAAGHKWRPAERSCRQRGPLVPLLPLLLAPSPHLPCGLSRACTGLVCMPLLLCFFGYSQSICTQRVLLLLPLYRGGN